MVCEQKKVYRQIKHAADLRTDGRSLQGIRGEYCAQRWWSIGPCGKLSLTGLCVKNVAIMFADGLKVPCGRFLDRPPYKPQKSKTEPRVSCGIRMVSLPLIEAIEVLYDRAKMYLQL